MSSTERIVVLLGKVIIRSTGLPSKASSTQMFSKNSMDGTIWCKRCTSKLNFALDHETSMTHVQPPLPTAYGYHLEVESHARTTHVYIANFDFDNLTVAVHVLAPPITLKFSISNPLCYYGFEARLMLICPLFSLDNRYSTSCSRDTVELTHKSRHFLKPIILVSSLVLVQVCLDWIGRTKSIHDS